MAPAKRRPASPASQEPTSAPAPEAPAAADQPPAPPPPRRGRVRAPDVPTPPPRRSRGRAEDGPAPPPAAPASDDLLTAPAATKDSAQLLGPDGEPIAQEAPTRDAGGDSAPPAETGHVDPEDPATTPSPGRSRAAYPERVWPD